MEAFKLFVSFLLGGYRKRLPLQWKIKKDMIYSIEEVITQIGAQRYGSNSAKIGFLLTDSRSLCFPEETLFFALKTDRNDGHHYIPELYRRGVRNFVVSSVPVDYEHLYPEANFLRVLNPCKALQ